MTALKIGNDYRASLAVFLSSPLSDKQIAKERRRAERAGLSFTVKNVVTRELFWGRFAVTKPLSQKHRSTFLPLQDADPTPSFGGFGLRATK